MNLPVTRGVPAVYRAVASLYVGYGLCLGLLQVALPSALQKAGLPIEQAGYLALLFLPFGLSALWAPLVDRYRPFGLERRLGWVVISQLVVVASLVFIAFAGTAQIGLLAPALAILAFAAATMDVTLDGYLSETSENTLRATRGGLKVSCMYAGTILGATFALLLLERLGWRMVLTGAAILCGLALIPFLMFFTVARTPSVRPRPTFRRFLIERRMGGRAMLLAGLGILLGLGLAAPRLLMVARGVPLETIGILFGPVGMISGFCGALAGMVLGRKRGSANTLFLASGVFATGALGMGFLPEPVFTSPLASGAAIALCASAYGATYGNVSALALGWVTTEQAATDYAIVQSLWNSSIIAGSSLAGLALAQAGSLVFAFCAFAIPLAVAFLVRSSASIGPESRLT